MGSKYKRKIIKVGNSKAMTIPAFLLDEDSDETTAAADRLILADPRGEIDEDDLLEFMEKRIEPQFWKWREEKLEAE